MAKPMLHEEVELLERKYIAMRSLCGEVLATLTVTPNRQHLHPQLRKLAEGWKGRFDKLTSTDTDQRQ